MSFFPNPRSASNSSNALAVLAGGCTSSGNLLDVNYQNNNPPSSSSSANLPASSSMFPTEIPTTLQSNSLLVGGTPTAAQTAAANNCLTDNDLAFACHICLEGVKDKDPVVTQCGHLYCWPCLYRWLHTRHGEGTCPVCKASVSQENVIPIFIRGSTVDPRTRTAAEASTENIPSRPQAHRPEPNAMDMQNNNLANLPFNVSYNTQVGGVSFAAGFGFFPSLFGLQFQSFAPSPVANGSDAEEEEQRKYLSRVLLVLGVTVILCLLFF